MSENEIASYKRKVVYEVTKKVRQEILRSIDKDYLLVPKQQAEIDAEYFVNVVASEVAKAFNVTQYDIMVNKSREKPLPDCRAAISYICKVLKKEKITFKEIGKRLNKTHGALIQGKRQCEDLMFTDKKYKRFIEDIIKSVKTITDVKTS